MQSSHRVLVETRRESAGGRSVFEFLTAGGHPVVTRCRLVREGGEPRLKWAIGISTGSGCPMRCSYCYARSVATAAQLTPPEIVEQAARAFQHPPGSYDRLSIELAQMGEPLLNPQILSAIEELAGAFPQAEFLVSTTAPLNGPLGPPAGICGLLAGLRRRGLQVRLRITCQSTGEPDRQRIHPDWPVASLDDLAAIAASWFTGPADSRTTLSFVDLDGCELDAAKVMLRFDPRTALIRVVSPDDAGRAPSPAAAAFASRLAAAGFEIL